MHQILYVYEPKACFKCIFACPFHSNITSSASNFLFLHLSSLFVLVTPLPLQTFVFAHTPVLLKEFLVPEKLVKRISYIETIENANVLLGGEYPPPP